MAKTQINFRASALTARHLAELVAKTGMSQTEVLSVAIDRMHTQEVQVKKRTMLLIKAEKQASGRYALVAEDGSKPQEGFEHDTAKQAYEDARQLWPANSVWHGRRVPGGYRIEIE